MLAADTPGRNVLEGWAVCRASSRTELVRCGEVQWVIGQRKGMGLLAIEACLCGVGCQHRSLAKGEGRAHNSESGRRRRAVGWGAEAGSRPCVLGLE